MFARAQKRFGSAGLVIAVLALVAALCGAAFAAGGLTKPQEKRVKQLVKKYSKPGPQGPAGVQGAQGSKGDPGAKGDTGAEGKQGVPGEDGEDGEPGEDGFCSLGNTECVLPPGALLTGNWAVDSPGSTEAATECEFGCFAMTTISYPLRVEPAVETRVFMEEGATPTEECPGNAEHPDAKAGVLCLYAGGSLLNGFGPLFGSTTDPTSGAQIRFEHVDPEKETRVFGTWAVRSPCPEAEPNC